MTKAKHDYPPKNFVLCLVGVEKFHTEKELIKLLRKHLETTSRPLPVHSVHKKRGTAFAFLNFNDGEQMKEFERLFAEEMNPSVISKHLRLSPINNPKKIESKSFKNVKSADTMLMEGKEKKDNILRQVTDEDILKEVSVDV